MQIATCYQATLSHIQVKVQFKTVSMLSCWDPQRDDEAHCYWPVAKSQISLMLASFSRSAKQLGHV